ncbi:MAG TPA: hypothetical protein VJZ25_01400 [Gemmatimonadaceae bacterium]|nr:hypothetical protein [Gemmatimonadaceae bacterium]
MISRLAESGTALRNQWRKHFVESRMGRNVEIEANGISQGLQVAGDTRVATRLTEGV